MNKSQEIKLRLRTDDLRGFCNYDQIKKVLWHELAHNEYSEHDDDFKALMAELEREVRVMTSANIIAFGELILRDEGNGDKNKEPYNKVYYCVCE